MLGRHAVVDADDLVAFESRHQHAFADSRDPVPEDVAASVDVEDHLVGLLFRQGCRCERIDAHAPERSLFDAHAVLLGEREGGRTGSRRIVLRDGAHGLGRLLAGEPEIGRGCGDALCHFGAYRRGSGEGSVRAGRSRSGEGRRKRKRERERERKKGFLHDAKRRTKAKKECAARTREKFARGAGRRQSTWASGFITIFRTGSVRDVRRSKAFCMPSTGTMSVT